MTYRWIMPLAVCVLAAGCGASGNGLVIEGTSRPAAPTSTPATSAPSTTHHSTTDVCDPHGAKAGCVTRRISIGSNGAVAYDSGVLWVAAQPSRGLYGTLIQVEAATGRRSSQPPVPLPASSDPYKLAVGDGGLWLSGDGQVWEINPATGQPRITVNAGAPVTGLVMAQGSVWATAGTSAGGSVLEIDPADGRVTRRTSLAGEPTAITVAGKSVWVAETTGDTLIQFDSTSLKQLHATQLAEHPTWEPTQLTVMFGRVWVYERSAAVGLRASDSQLLWTQPIQAQKSGGDMAGGGTSLWVAAGHGRRDAGAVVRLSPKNGNQIGHAIPIGGRITAMATGNSVVWALDGARGLLFEITPS